jgi:hypothetical protein
MAKNTQAAYAVEDKSGCTVEVTVVESRPTRAQAVESIGVARNSSNALLSGDFSLNCQVTIVASSYDS